MKQVNRYKYLETVINNNGILKDEVEGGRAFLVKRGTSGGKCRNSKEISETSTNLSWTITRRQERHAGSDENEIPEKN